MTDREIADETAKLRTLVHEAQGARFKDRIMLVGMLDAAAKTIRSQCYDHVDNCCSDWCDMCKTGERLRDEWIEAYKAMKERLGENCIKAHDRAEQAEAEAEVVKVHRIKESE